MNDNFIKLEDTLNSDVCLSFYKPDLNDFKLENENNLKRQQEKFNILKEILSSEKKYLNDIKEIVEGYYEELKKSSNEEFLYHIFSNIKEIYEFTKSFYGLLEASTNDEVGIASCFIKKHKTFFRLYSTYCQNYKLAYSTTEKLERDHNTAKSIQKVRLRYGHCLKMATYLQLPVLRITKYHLLLQRYLKLLDKDSIGYSQVLEALELMKQVNDQINNDMPQEDLATTEKISSTVNLQNLVKLFGTILKQGNLIFAQTKKVHYVIVFQTMLIIRKCGSTTKIFHSISNEFLAFLPTTSTSNKTKYFTVIDYSQSKDDDMWQFTFKAKSVEEKQSWQSAILSCMLNGYGKKLSENIKTKVLKIDSCSDTSTLPRKSTGEITWKKLTNFKRLTDFRSSIKSEFKENETSTLENTTNIEDLENQRRLSAPITHQSRFVKILDRTINLATLTKENGSNSLRRFMNKHNQSKDEHKIDSIFSKFRKDKSEAYKRDLSFNSTEIAEKRSKSTTLDNVKCLKNKSLDESAIELARRVDFIHAFEQFDTSFEDITGSIEENIIPHYLKKLENSLEKKFKSIKSDSSDSNTSSKSSINSEEGYYSCNQDSSLSTLVVEQSPQSDNSSTTINNIQRTFSTPEILKKMNFSLLSFDESYALSDTTDCKEENKSYVDLDLNQSTKSCQSISKNSHKDNSMYSTKSVNITKRPPLLEKLKTGRNLNSSLSIITKSKSNQDSNNNSKENNHENDSFSNDNENKNLKPTRPVNHKTSNSSLLKFSRIKNLQNKFQESCSKNPSPNNSSINNDDNLNDSKSQSLSQKSKSINSLKPNELDTNVIFRKSSLTNNTNNNSNNISIHLNHSVSSYSTNRINENKQNKSSRNSLDRKHLHDNNDSETDLHKLNVKELINRFETNKGNHLINAINCK